MILRNGTIVSNMARSKTPSSRNTSSSDEMNNEGEDSPIGSQPLEPVLTLVTTTGRTITTQAPSNISTMTMSTLPMYGLPPSFVPPMATQALAQQGIGAVTTTFHNRLYTNTIMSNLPSFRSLPGPSAGPR